jgi:cation diffusion facilitator CzcD-associated flavoprotein CzcO
VLLTASSGITLAARLKALRVDYIVVDKNPGVGDNWAFRYDCLRFHLPTAVSEMPYLREYKLRLVGK